MKIERLLKTKMIIIPWVVGQIKSAGTGGGLRKGISSFRAKSEKKKTELRLVPLKIMCP